jgi:uncharacterized protein DUF6600
MGAARVRNLERRWVFILLTWLLAGPLFADVGDPPARVARLSYMQGNVSLQVSGASDWSQATLNYPLTTGDRIYADQGARAELEVGSAAVRLFEATDLTVANLQDQVMQLGLGQGSIRLAVYAMLPGNSIEVDTPNGALSLLQAGYYRVDTFPNDGATLVTVNNGSLEVSGGDVVQRVQGGQAVKLTGTDPIQVSLVSLPGPDDFDAWSRERDRRFASSASARYVGRGLPGYYDLDDYGRWQPASEYGPIWFPAAVPVGWVPYRVGRWVWVEPWGWTWVEDELWGFCPFHYGRWVFVGSAWGWVPGPVVARPLYAPALVAFLGGPHFSIGISIGGGVQGWFPLGPSEPYFPWYHYGGDYLRQVNVTNVRNVTNITNITNVTNITNIRYVNREAGATVVPIAAFQSGERIDRQVVRVKPEQIRAAQIVPHPETVPTARTMVGGRPVPAPPVRPVRFEAVAASGQRPPAPPARATQPNQPPLPTPRAEQPSRPPVVTGATAPETRASRGERGHAAGPPATPPELITRRPPPPPRLPFPERQQAMQNHPGRPLEPSQIENLRAGRPAGPPRDKEFPPHPEPYPRATRQERGSKPESKPEPKQRNERKQ